MHTTSLKEIYDRFKNDHVIYQFDRVDDNNATLTVRVPADNAVIATYHIELRS